MSIICNGCPERLNAELSFQGCRQFPADHEARVPVNDRVQVTESMFGPNVGDIGTPNVVRMRGRDTFQEVRIYRVLFVRNARIYLLTFAYLCQGSQRGRETV
jgi:hypothetical protein